MRNQLTKFFISLSLFIGVLAPAAPVYAAGGSISLTASKSTVASGGTLIIAVYANGGGTGINAVQADLSYPASKLQYVGFSASGSAFEIGANSGGGDGLASLSRGTINSVGGSALVGTVTFKALVGSGSAAISVAGSSSLVSDGNAVPYSAGGVSVNFGGVAAAAPSTSAKPAAPAPPPPPKDTTPPTVSAVKVTALTPFSATITWTTSEPADSTVDFGVDDKYGLSSSAAGAVTAHSVALNSSFLTPLTLLHYRVKSTDGAGNAATSQDQTFQLPGVPVTVIVRGSDGKPQAGAVVTLDSQTGTTDSAGSVTLRSSLGNKKITTSYQGVTIQKPISVNKSTKPLPPYQLDLSKQPLNPWMLTSAGLFALVIVLLVIDAALFGSRILARITGLHFLQPLHHSAHAAATEAAPTVDIPNLDLDAPLEAPLPEEIPDAELQDTPVDPMASIAELMGDPAPVAPPAPSPAPVPSAAPAPASAPAPDVVPIIGHGDAKAVTPQPLVIQLAPVAEPVKASAPPVPMPASATPTATKHAPKASAAKRVAVKQSATKHAPKAHTKPAAKKPTTAIKVTSKD